MKTLLISACLLGVACRYDGLSKPLDREILDALKKQYQLIPICPEIMGGLPTPRVPAEITPERTVFRRDGADVTENYGRGAREALRLAELFSCEAALLKERSPSCGSGRIYDGSFTKTLTDGDGIAAALLKKSGIRVVGESEIFSGKLL
ncbi:MAG: DUF523 domain-containing protein [Clostridia bacterium]|nr:DUF523 domain-containing protein [Clostridia bacterium]